MFGPGGEIVTKVGRNDPCPCGSGKKYKYCCLRKETTTKSEVISGDRARSQVMEKLLAFSREDRFAQDLRSAFDLFWNRSHALEEAESLDPMQVMGFFDWYVHDYSTSADGRSIVDIFLTEPGSPLSDQERGFLHAAQDSLFSAYQVTDIEQWKTLKLLEVFEATQHELPYTSSLEGIEVGQLLLGRLVTSGGITRLSSITTLVPPEVEDDLKAYIQEMFAKYQEDHYQASWKEFLRARSYLFNHFMLKLRGELPARRVFMPHTEEQEEQTRPLVLTPQRVEPKERKQVLVPGEEGEEVPSRVLIPGRDR
jgi:hypothetical protein